MQERGVQSLGWEDCWREGHSNPLQCSCLGNPMDRGAWQAAVHRVAESDTTEATEHAQSQKRPNSCYSSRLQVATWVSRIWSPGWESLSTQTQISSSPRSLTIRRCGKTPKAPEHPGAGVWVTFSFPSLNLLPWFLWLSAFLSVLPRART